MNVILRHGGHIQNTITVFETIHLYVLPKFLTVAVIPTPSPIVPKEPSAVVSLVTVCTKLFKMLTIVFNPSEFTIELINSFQLLVSLFRLPCRLLADLFRNIQYHPQHDISC